MNVNNIFMPSPEYRLPRSLTYAVFAICILPFLLQLLSVDFGNSDDFTDINNQAPSVDQMFYLLAGGFTHALLEWSAFCAAIFVVLLSFCHYAITKDVTTPVIGVALFCAGAMDAFHTLAATRLVTAVAANQALIPFTWALSRVFNALIMIIGVGIFLQGKRFKPKKGMAFIVMISLGFSLIGYVLIHLSATSHDLPQTQFPDAIIRRPYDIVPLLLFIVAGLFVYPMFMKRYPSIFATALLLSALPEIAVEIHMAFGSQRLFDSDFNVAHFLKIVAYVVPLAGLVLDYIRTYQKQIEHHTDLQIAHTKLNLKARQMSELNDNLSQSNSELEKFAYIASHDLQEPLRKIQAFGDRLHSTLDSNVNEKALDYVDRMQKASTRMRDLIDDLLKFSHVGSYKYNLRELDLNKLLVSVTDDLQVAITEKNAQLTVESLPIVMAEKNQLYQVFLNIISNALKFSKQGQAVQIRVYAEEKLVDEQTFWQISIEDNGIGFDPQYSDKIFEIFQRLHGRSKYEGTGIGLAVCKKIIDRHNGKISVESELGKGSRFILLLPALEKSV